MPSRSLVVRLALLVAASLLPFSGCDCGRECSGDSDCSGNQVCQAGQCVEPDAGPATCSPACPVGQFCDTGSLTCKLCDGTLIGGTQINRGCTAAQPICDTAANGGAGQCRNCAPTSTDGGTDDGCFGTTPICNPNGNAGNGQCITCSSRGGCGTTRVCDVSADGGVCRNCLASTDGGVAPGCSSGEPICNVQQNRCIVCTATQGCSGAAAFCDPTASGGKGVCQYCRPATDGGVGPGCDSASPLCDLSRDGGLGACIVCNGGAGCTPDLICETAANGGSGQCRFCYQSGASTDPGCNSGSPVCDTAGDAGLGSCLGCLTSTDCATPPNFVCDPLVNSCKRCILLPAPEGCSATQTCDPLANGGQGACLGCGVDEDCVPDGGSSPTPHCNPTPPPGVCVECTVNTHCTDSTRPACNTSNICGCEANPDCATPTPICDAPASSGNGICVVCTPTQGCTSPDAPHCAPDQSACICVGNEDCDVNEVCTGTPATCTPITQANADIPAFIAAAAGTVNLQIREVYVTYLKPQVGSLTNDPAGFFIQAVAGGPAMFVAVDPSTVNGGGPVLVGDRISFTATSKVVINGTDAANVVTGFSVLSSNHPVRNLSTAAPAGLVVDRSAATDLVTALNTYESTLIRITGTIAGPFTVTGTAHMAANFDTAGVTGNANLRIRFPDTILAQVDLTPGCQVTIRSGPMWRFNATAQPSAYSLSELTGITCPGPKVLSAIALSDTSVQVVFDRLIDATSVQAGDFAIPGITVSDAQASGRTVTLTVSGQAADQAYTVTVTGVLDTIGTPVDAAANTATFYGYVGAQTGLVINEVDYDQVNADTAEFIELTNIGTSPVSLHGLEVVLVNGGSTSTPRREYARYRLNQVTDGTNPVVQLPVGGVVVLGPTAVVGPLPAGVPRMAITPAQDAIQNGGVAATPQSDGLGIIHFATGTLVDALFYENSTQSALFDILTGAGDVQRSFVEGTRTQFEDGNATAGSVQRRKIGAPPAPQDTNDNNVDFELVGTPTPGVQ